MPTIGTVALVQARITYETISADSNPTSTQVETFLDQVEARLEGALVAAELPVLTSYSASTRPYNLLAEMITTGAVGLVKEAWETAKGEMTERSAETLYFDQRCADIEQFPSKWGSMLDVGGSPPAASKTLRSHATDSTVLAERSDGTLPAPIFTVRSDPGAQF